MYREVKLGSHTVPMVANAATVIRYRQIFGRDLLLMFSKADTEMTFTGELAFVMAKQAEKADMSRLNIESYIEWAEQFDALDLFAHESSEAVVDLFSSQQKTLVKEKKKADAQNDK